MKRIFVGVIVVFFFQLTTSADLLLDETAMEQIDAHYKKGIELFRDGKFQEMTDEFQAVLERNPGDDVAMYLVAAGQSRAKKSDAAMESLRKLEAAGSCLSPMVRSFADINQTSEFREVAEKIARRASTMQHSSTVVAVPEKDLTPEGIVYDPNTKTFYLSSLYKRKIVSVRMPDDPGEQPVIRDFITEAQDGYYCGLGMKIDSKRRQLWSASSAENIMKGYGKADEGKTALFIFDLESGKLVRKFEKGPNPAHLMNDLVLSGDGTGYITDTQSGEIFRLKPDGKELETLVGAGKFASPNGIAISDDDKKLYVADSMSGVSLVDPATGTVRRLRQASGIAPVLMDGLYFYQGSLIAINNTISGGRVVRFYFNKENDAIVRSEVLDCNNPLFQLPTTGALGDGWFYYIANSQYASFHPDGSIFPMDQLRDVVILKSKL